jgi:exopolyphosphatase/guanosine-5'-triphosphate,3'-diphosphate pyrophosphatase
LLVAEVAGRDVKPLLEESRQTRLGSGFYKTRRLQPGPVATTAEAVTAYAKAAQAWGARSIRVVATSAARDAENSQDLTGAIENACGLKVEIISGDQEADWVFSGVTTDHELAAQPLLLIDVGGGSTEFIVGRGEQKQFRQSFPLGTVRLLESTPRSDPPTAQELASCRQWLSHFLDAEVKPKLAPWLRVEPAKPFPLPLRLVGTGGTASILARIEAGLTDFDRRRIEGTRLSFARIQWHTNHLWSLPLAQRRNIPGLPPKRADVILMGVAIYEAVMANLGFQELRVSTRGLRFAAVMEGA